MIGPLTRLRHYLSVFYCHPVKLHQIKTRLNHQYKDLPSYSLSKTFRQQVDPNPDFVYGELDVGSFIYLCQLASKHHPFRLCDLGSGDGKLIHGGAMYFANSHFTGVEIVPALHQAASLIKSKLAQYYQQHTKVQLIHQDMVELDLTPFDLLYLNLGAISEPTWQKVSQQLKQLTPGTKVISIARQLPSPFRLIYEGKHPVSWGQAWVRIYQMVPNP